MSVRLRERALTIPLAAATTVLLATSALAATTISIKASQVPVTASEFDEHEDCDFPGLVNQTPPDYGWHFVLPGGEATFVSLTATFETAGTITLPGPNGGFVQDGKGAVIFTPTDDTLTGATAEIEGTTPQGDFVLSHTCLPVTESETPTPSVSATASATPSESETPSPSVSATETPSPEVSGTVLTSSPAGSESVSPSVLGVKQTKGAVGGTGLPSTGVSLVGLLVLACLAIALGIGLAKSPRGRYAR